MRGRWVAIAVFVLGGLAAGVSWMLRVRKETLPPAPQAYVSTSWDAVRDTPGHRVHVGMLQKPCTGCHDAVDSGLDQPGPEKCAKCHEPRTHIKHGHMVEVLASNVVFEAADGGVATAADASSALHARDGGTTLALSRCTDCHGFGVNAADAQTDCIRCHRSEQGDVHAVVTHATAHCLDCHQVHENQITPKDCTNCHKVSVKHGHAKDDMATQCRACHDVHAEAHFAQDRCLTCHGPKGERPVPHTAVFDKGHTCASCHRPHEFDKSGVAACRDCHKEVHPLAGHERQNCVGCHQPHAVRAQIEGGAVCSSCHKNVALTHAGKHNGDLGACIGCHQPHPPKPNQGPEACSSCHQEIGGPTHAAHAKSLTCTSCHAPHAFHLELSIGLCRDCHAAQVTALQKRSEHKECTSCHQGLPHTMGSPVQPCGACHKQIQSKVHQGHAECRSCHQPHQASVQLASCEHCHAKQAKQHPRGHDQCMKCHDQHESAPKPGVADCSACHKAKKLSGLHREAKHLENGCQQCHAPHGVTPPGDRQGCLSCHKDRVDHQPEATRCDGCHTFIGVQAGRAP
ncbi:MAG TPA: cytochrome c3 family protein [Polyangiales bacterium]